MSEIAPGLGDYFRDACQLLSGDQQALVSTTHLAAHLLREVDSALLDVLASLDMAEVRVPKESRAAKVGRVSRFLGAGEDSALDRRWAALGDDESALHRRAHRDGLERPRPLNTEFQRWFDEVVTIWSEVVGRYRGRFLKVLEYIDSVVGQQDPPKDLAQRVPKSQVAYKYLFERINNPRWLSTLKKRGFFENPPPLQVSEGGGIRAEVWPQAEYLGRMARCDDVSVHEAALEIMLEATSTNNYLIHEVFTEAALLMPVEMAAKWAERETAALGSWEDLPFGWSHDLGKLGARLASEGKADAALGLCSQLFYVLPPQEERDERQEGEGRDTERPFRHRPEPRFKCDQHTYKEILQHSLPLLLAVAPGRTLKMFCHLLEKAIAPSAKEGETAKPRDYTSMRRAAIEDHGQNHGHDIADPLVSAVRDAATAVCAQAPENIESVVTMLESHGWDIFKRIGMHLLTVAEAPPIKLVERRLVDPGLFDYIGVHHEYFHLLRRRFAELSPEGQAKILGWVDSGEHHKAYLDKHEQEWSAEQRAGNLRYWQYTKLLCIEEHLRGDHARRLEELRREFGEPGIPPDFHSWVGEARSIGLESPWSLEELALLSVDDLVSRLKNWKTPGRSLEGPSREGLGSKIEALIASDPEKYAARIESIKDGALAPIYLGYVVSGLAKALENGKMFPFEPLLALCSWIVDSSEAERRQAADDPGDRREEWARPRHDIARLLTKMFDDKYGFPIELRDQVWKIIEPLTNDPDPDLAYESRYGGENMDPLSLSINSIRGNAMHGVGHYALWVCRKNETDTASGAKRRLSLADMPEVRAVLAAHLEPGSQFALNQMDRAVYGDWLPQLMYVDEEWVRANLGRLFPESPGERHLRRAAWNAYVVYVRQIYKQAYDLIKGIYRDEIRHLATDAPRKKDYHDPEQKLGEHAVVIYARGWDDLAEGSLVDLFFTNAPEELRAHVLGFLGRDLRNDTPLEDDTVARFKALWEWRVAALTAADKVSEKELGEFGWWFISGRCGDDWAFHHLEKVLERTGALSGDSDVFERVSQVFEGHPRESLRCLRLFVEKNQNPWFFNLERRGGTWEILRKGLASGDVMIRDAAEEIVHLLGSKGYLKFRDLLRKNLSAQEGGVS